MFYRSILFSAVIFGVLVASLPHILWLLGWIVSKIFNFRLSYAPFGWTAAALVLILWTVLACGYFHGRFRLKVNNIEYCDTSVPESFDGFRIVHISDLHAGTFKNNPNALQRIVDKINAADADMVCFTGDMATESMDELKPFKEMLASIKARNGVASILGNHDFFIYSRRTDEERCAAADSLTRFERESLGWTVLRNSNLIVRRGGDSIAVAGIDNAKGDTGFPTIQKGDLPKALSGLPEGIFTILLSHDPGFWKSNIIPESNVQLTLSGHTHAGQARFFGHSISSLVFKECDGRYDIAEGGNMRTLYVTAGLGCTLQVRINCPSEIAVITLRHKN